MYGTGGHYRAWAEFLDRWGRSEPADPGQLPQLAETDFTGDSWERLTNRITGAISQRLESWAAALTRAMGQARDEFTVARSLGHARWELESIRAVAGHHGLPVGLRDRLVDMVDRQVRSAQQSLEEQVDRLRRDGVDRRLVETRLRTLRDNPLTVRPTTPPPVSAPTPAPAAEAAWSTDLSVRPRRRIVD
ncbi:hypothetical protein O7632_01085 [Solwaraspora sp. WMMD406]|uniref:hypothetical protein n=1 Tax=Solwaraspora sp. WMMD406 TaxID=3016095 RepID=UPI002417EA84|nr:hypothetical protein [Solwaraspora sp. WMMD406]MDG4762716.1 hypothetical protein [Solwaraspora sp. WMMD406]